MKKRRIALVLSLAAATLAARAGPLDDSECIVGAKAGGGFDLTCRLAQAALQDEKLIDGPMRLTYVPGGIGAVAFNNVVSQQPAKPNAIVAFSGGSLLNLAQGKFGRRSEADVRWLAAVGVDFGAVMVADKSPYQSLKDVMAALKAHPNKVVFGGGGTVGSQDWMKAALTARAAGVDHKAMRFVAFEGGGEAITALQGGHIDVFMGDVAESMARLRNDRGFRIIAVMSDRRLPGPLAGVATAKEQGFDLQWPIMRGFYMGPQVGDGDFAAWNTAFKKLVASPAFARLRDEAGMHPMAMTGTELGAHVRGQVQAYRRLATEFGLNTAPPAPR